VSRRFLGASIEADRTLLVMEYMHGGDLLSQIRHDDQGMFKWHKWGRSIALDVARGLTYLHSHDVSTGEFR
jgi:serine/threonine protein kinase